MESLQPLRDQDNTQQLQYKTAQILYKAFLAGDGISVDNLIINVDDLEEINSGRRYIQNVESGASHGSDAGVFTYIGLADRGAGDGAASWFIKRIDEATGTTKFAQEPEEFNQVWNNRTTLSYS